MPTNEMTSLNKEKTTVQSRMLFATNSSFDLTSSSCFVASVQVGNRNLRGLQIDDHVSISSDCCMVCACFEA